MGSVGLYMMVCTTPAHCVKLHEGGAKTIDNIMLRLYILEDAWHSL